MELRKFGAITNKELLHAMDWPDADKVSAEADAQMQQQAQQQVVQEAMQKGQGQGGT